METGIQKAIRLAGNQTNLALAVGLSPQAIHKWVQAGKPSANGCLDIEKAFPGQVTRAELNPALFGELVN
ncbi:DNA-binding transcriptional regulator YdaS (Cro superfamily) [Oxalobacteraceae bacterium GrIS 1.11]